MQSMQRAQRSADHVAASLMNLLTKMSQVKTAGAYDRRQGLERQRLSPEM
jgi:hypothetical protein